MTHKNPVQTRITTIHSRVAILAQPNKEEIPRIDISINVIETCMITPECMEIEEIQLAAIGDGHICNLSNYILCDWPATKAKVQKEVKLHWSFRYNIAVIEGIAMKRKRIIIPTSPQKKAPDQLHIIHMGIEGMKLLGH